MISEKTFCSQFSTFWRETLPNLDAVVRAVNLGYERVSDPPNAKTSPKRRDFVSEAGYRLFFLSKDSSGGRDYEILEKASREAFIYLSERTNDFWNDEFYITDQEGDEIFWISDWLRRYFSSRRVPINQVIRPHYSGHGILSSCEGDFSTSNRLFEMKYVERNFRGTDFKQVLTYSALMYYETGGIYEEIVMLNPFKGIQFRTNAQQLVSGAAGISIVDFYKRMSYVLSSGEISH